MKSLEQFNETIKAGYSFKSESILLGAAMFNKTCQPEAKVQIPLRMLNRHGLIAGATGTGKTKTLQVLAEQLSANSVPTLLMDIKGDLSGIAQPGERNEKIQERHKLIGIDYSPAGFPVELLSLSDEKGVRLRATVSEFGPVLFSKILGLNDTQTGVMALVFKYCDDNQLPLLDFNDLRKTLQYISSEGKSEIEKTYGMVSTTTIGTILRKMIELEQQGAGRFFGERSFEVADLCRIDELGRGIISILRVTDIQDRPKLFSTFMLQLLAEIYASFPEEGDLDRPKLVLFIDEAHLLFDEASKALLDQIEAIVKLIRSKGVGVFFVTQNPADIPNEVLRQLGLKIQHALRAFTAKDRKDLKLAVQNYPDSEFYEVETLLTELGTGEAFVTTLNEKGIPTPLVHTLLRAPASRMNILSPAEIDQLCSQSNLIAKYNNETDRESAFEILTRKMQQATALEQQTELQKQQEKARTTVSRKTEKSTFEEVLTSAPVRQIGNTLARELTRGLLGVMGLGGRRR